MLFGADCEQGLPHSFVGGTPLPWQMALGSSQDPDAAFEVGRILGAEARRWESSMCPLFSSAGAAAKSRPPWRQAEGRRDRIESARDALRPPTRAATR